MSTAGREPFARHLHPLEMALIARHGRNFAVNHGLDFAAVRPPEDGERR